jgi:hypothetical protein
MLADDELRADKLAADIKDYGDADHTRTELSTYVDDQWLSETFDVPPRPIEYRTSGTETIRINELMVRPVRRVEAEMLTYDTQEVLPAYPGPGIPCNPPDPDYNPYLMLFDPNPPRDVSLCQPRCFSFSLGAGNGFSLDFDMVQDFVPYNLWVTEPWDNAASGAHLGTGAVLWTNTVESADVQSAGVSEPRYVRPTDPTYPIDNDSGWMPNVVQFRFGPSTGLPPGRYYLIINTRDANGDPTVLADDTTPEPYDTSDIEFAIKYGYADGLGWDIPYTSILADMDDEWLGVGDIVLEPWGWNVWQRNAVLGLENMDDPTSTESGYVLLPSSSVPSLQPPEYVPEAQGGLAPNNMNPLVGYFQNHAFTVVIPEAASDPAQQVYLYVAIRKPINWDGWDTIDGIIGDNNVLAIDFFDFSQEPDHEWIELVNIAEWDPEEQATDLSGWQLAVGPLGADGSRLFTIPDGTFIAPGGSLLLSFNKHDYGVDKFNVNLDDPAQVAYWDDAYRNMGAFERNGIGLASVSSYEGVGTVPTTLDPASGLLGDPRDFVSVPLLNLVDGTQPNVFDPAGVTDFVDADGDGVPLYEDVNRNGIFDPAVDNIIPVPDDLVLSTVDTAGFVGMEDAPDKAWDRIVQLESDLDKIVQSDYLDEVAKVVLAGGVLPNYPEEDGIDNDGDNAILENDGVDNNGNAAEWDWDPDLVDWYVDEPGEGIDEGRWTEAAAEGFDRPGSFQRADGNEQPEIVFRDLDGAPKDMDMTSYSGEEPDDLNDPVNVSPAWRAFVERRWYPGDCVIVTLYEGSAGMGHVADRVTYTQQDVINRAIDDGVPIPTIVDPVSGDVPVRELWNVRYDTMWPENTMGIDFYRSLERKHPLYSGDRFGTQNRWQATDGNYDDWDDSLSLWAATGQVDPALYGFTLIGSPLTHNYYHRRLEDGVLLESPNTADPARFNRGAPEWHGSIRNRPYQAPGDVLRMPHFTLRADWIPPTASGDPPFFGGLLSTSGHTDHEWVAEILIVDRSSGELLFYYDPQEPDNRYKRKLVLTGAPVDRVALVVGSTGGINSPDVLTLTVAQAEKPLLLNPNYIANPDDDTWTEDPWPKDSRNILNLPNPPYTTPDPAWTPGNPAIAPAGFPEPYTPVYLFSFLDVPGLALSNEERAREEQIKVTALFDGEALFNSDWCPGFARGLDTDDLLARWSEPLRRCFYVSRNFGSFSQTWPRVNPNDPTKDLAASPTAFFVWRADAGIENGRYDVSIVFDDPLKTLREMFTAGSIPPAGAASSILTPFGQALLDGPDLGPGENMAAYVRFYTDPKYYRQPELINLDHVNPALEDVGALPERLAEPGPNGMAYVGTVLIEHNFLAMRIRNWTPTSQLSTFGRLVLTPKDRVPGKINLNTVTTHSLDDNTEVFNPLVGLPGLLFDYDPGNPLTPVQWPFTPYDAIGMPDFADARTVAERSQVIDPLNSGDYPLRLYDRTYSIMTKRPEWPDGRYYRCPSELLGYIPLFEALDAGTVLYADDPWFPWLAERVVLDATSGSLVPAWNTTTPILQTNPLVPQFEEDDFARIGLIAPEAERLRFDEAVFRYSGMTNLITARSDVFEIIVTAQSGSGTDANNDGRINYRDPNEFTPNAEKKIRTVYSR